MEKQQEYYVYMLRCGDDTLYTGYTNDLKRREATHNAGKGAKYTRSRRPVRIVWSETFQTKHDAMCREAEVKRMTRAEKLKLVEMHNA